MKTTFAICLILTTTSVATAENWAQWRGPAFNGSTTEVDLPTKFSPTENVVWSADLPGPGAATPVIWQDKVFISSTDAKADSLEAICLSRKTGEKLWQRQIAKGTRKDYRSLFCAPSPATDGEVVVYFYGNGDLVTFDLDGEKLWARNIQKDFGPFAFLWTFSSSPLLYDGKLFLQVLQRDKPVEGRGLVGRKNESYLLALDPKTGKTLWRVVRPSKAREESREAFSTPIPMVSGDREELLVVGGDALTGHDPATGKELWRWGTYNPTRITHWRLVPSPVAGGGVVLTCAPKRDPVYAVPVGKNGVIPTDDLPWISEDEPEVSSDVPTPAFYDGDFFVLSDVRKALTRVDPETGEVKWRLRTPGYSKYEASPLAADGKIYLINFVGEVVVVDAGSGKVLAINKMSEPSDNPVRSSVVAAHGNLFIRVNDKLYCVGG
jgi:outer membrane protein assembly factor BamB